VYVASKLLAAISSIAVSGMVTVYQLFADLLVLILMYSVFPLIVLVILTVPYLFFATILDHLKLGLIFSLNLIAIRDVLENPFPPFFGDVNVTLGG